MCPLYVAGLIGPGERKSIEPLAARMAPDRYDRLHHFIPDGIWDDVRHCTYYTRYTYIGVQGWREFYPEIAPKTVGCRAVKLFAVARPFFRWTEAAKFKKGA